MNKGLSPSRQMWNRVMTALVWASAVLVMVLVAGIIGMVLVRGIPHISWNFLSTTATEVIHWYTVDDVKRITALFDRFRTTHHYLAGSTYTGGTAVDSNTCHLTIQAVDEISIFNAGDFVRFHLLHIVAQCLLCPLDT